MRNTCTAVLTANGDVCAQSKMLLLVSCNRPWLQVKGLPWSSIVTSQFKGAKKGYIVWSVAVSLLITC